MRSYRLPGPSRSKMHNKPCWYEGIRFHSHKEMAYYRDVLFPAWRAGEISFLELQVPFPLMVNGVRVGVYRADFVYYDWESQRHIVDVKGAPPTDVYKLKKAILAANGIHIEEV